MDARPVPLPAGSHGAGGWAAVLRGMDTRLLPAQPRAGTWRFAI